MKLKLHRYELIPAICSVRRGDADGIKIFPEYNKRIKKILETRLDGVVYSAPTKPRIPRIRIVRSPHLHSIYGFVTPYPPEIIEECIGNAWIEITRDVEEQTGYSTDAILIHLRMIKVEKWPITSKNKISK
jgi:hypothetical protein